jgi:hypothetical protein
MELQFDLISFVLGAVAAIASLHLAQLAGYAAGVLFYRIVDRRKAQSQVCLGTISGNLKALCLDPEAAAKAYGQSQSQPRS